MWQTRSERKWVREQSPERERDQEKEKERETSRREPRGQRLKEGRAFKFRLLNRKKKTCTCSEVRAIFHGFRRPEYGCGVFESPLHARYQVS